jgi:hypothetical protein
MTPAGCGLPRRRTLYVNGDPVNLVDPNGHEPQSSFRSASDPCYGPHATVASCHQVEVNGIAFAKATQTHVGLYCVHTATDAGRCGSVQPGYSGLTNYCRSIQASCSLLATLYGPESSPAAADSPWVLDAASQIQHALAAGHGEDPTRVKGPALIDVGAVAGNVASYLAQVVPAIIIDTLSGDKVRSDGLSKVESAADRAAASSAPDFIVHPNGTVVVVPEGAIGPMITNNRSGFVFIGGTGGKGLDESVSGLRIMDRNDQNPGGYYVYMNGGNQTINPYNGNTLGPSDPGWHRPW